MDKYTPMMRAYLQTKEENKDSILFYRLGDFYEMFFEDAKTASKELDLVLTAKSCGEGLKAPMCGVPFHSAEGYVQKLVERGFKVAICEQVEDPKLAKGLVKREVVRIITPGTYMDETKDSSNYVACTIKVADEIGFSLADVSTGEFSIVHTGSFDKTIEEIIKTRPGEIICNEAFLMEYKTLSGLTQDIPVFTIENIIDDVNRARNFLSDKFSNGDLEHISPAMGLGLISAANLLNYLYETQKAGLSHINKLLIRQEKDHLRIDAFTYRNLELTESMRTKEKQGSLFHVLDKTKTAMGRRLLKSYIKEPLIDKEAIEGRLDAIEELSKDYLLFGRIGEILNGIYDIERLITRISYKNINPKEMISLKSSIARLPELKELLGEVKSKELKTIRDDMDDLWDIYELIEECVNEDAPISLRDGEIVRQGFNEDVDNLRSASTDGKMWLSRMEEQEREETGIKNLRIKFNRVFGYYIEVTNSFLNLVPEHYVRRQTLAGSERFYTPKLKELEDTILGAKEKLDRLEFDLYSDLLEKIFKNIERMQKSGMLLARLDVYLSLCNVAISNNYCRPTINGEGIINIEGGRHPVVESMLSKDTFIENDTFLDNRDNRLYLITGPNMAGKSTYMRQCALIALMAHMGSFVPAMSADICILDAIFTRVGASDDLSSGQSTFMVEMNEMAYILKNATKDSLIILDEIGRGTSTYDGLSLAWSIIEHIADKNTLGAKTLFATHYHELTVLEERLYGVINYSCAVSEKGNSIIFLRKIIKKAANKSYGIQVAMLAGIPEHITKRASAILDELISDAKRPEDNFGQLSLFDMTFSSPVESSDEKETESEEIKSEIRGFDVNNKSPMEALMFLNTLKEKYNL